MSSRWQQAGITLTLGSALLTAACSSGLVKSLAGLNALRQQLVQKYHDDVGVHVQNSRFLSIVFNNSPLNQQDPAKRAQRAQETARFAALNYQGIKEIDRIWVYFVASETRFIVFHYSRSIDAFRFDKNGMPISSGPDTREDIRAPVAKFNSSRNETDVSVTRLQLEGDMKHGIALVPHFTVPGDARQPGTPTTVPESVVLDFASYADKPVFSDNAKLEIHCDDRVALKGFARLLSGKESGDDATVPQFLSARISFRLFKRMAASRNVRITLGPKRFELVPDDISALEAMSAYVP